MKRCRSPIAGPIIVGISVCVMHLLGVSSAIGQTTSPSRAGFVPKAFAVPSPKEGYQRTHLQQVTEDARWDSVRGSIFRLTFGPDESVSCTAWAASREKLVTAGHCFVGRGQRVAAVYDWRGAQCGDAVVADGGLLLDLDVAILDWASLCKTVNPLPLSPEESKLDLPQTSIVVFGFPVGDASDPKFDPTLYEKSVCRIQSHRLAVDWPYRDSMQKITAPVLELDCASPGGMSGGPGVRVGPRGWEVMGWVAFEFTSRRRDYLIPWWALEPRFDLATFSRKVGSLRDREGGSAAGRRGGVEVEEEPVTPPHCKEIEPGDYDCDL